jgi:hypothetical protein
MIELTSHPFKIYGLLSIFKYGEISVSSLTPGQHTIKYKIVTVFCTFHVYVHSLDVRMSAEIYMLPFPSVSTFI